MIKFPLFTIVFLLCALPILAQEGVQVNFDVNGTVRSTDGFALPNFRVVFDRNGSRSDVRTDINGEFKTTLFHGNYLVSVEGGSRSTHLQVGRGMPDAPVDLILDASDLRDETRDYPVVERTELPAFPPAALAVRASGIVKVEARISIEGKVIEARYTEGHPLLRAASIQATRLWTFKPGSSERTVIVSFVFLPGSEVKKETKLQKNPYRHYIVAPNLRICP